MPRKPSPRALDRAAKLQSHFEDRIAMSIPALEEMRSQQNRITLIGPMLDGLMAELGIALLGHPSLYGLVRIESVFAGAKYTRAEVNITVL